MKIIKSTEPIVVPHPVFLIFGQPGIGKSSLGYSAEEPLLLDADRGAHRAVNRRDTIAVGAWPDIHELVESKGAIDPYKTIVLDTAGRVLDFLAIDLMENNPKFDRGGGNLSLPGFGALKSGFQNWLMRVRNLDKDVVLICHGKEEKDGDSLIVRPDMTGGSYAELMKVADFVGYLYMRGKDRVLDFNPTDRWVGKNPAQWKPIVVPAADKATRLLADLMIKGHEALGSISGESAKLAQAVQDWREAMPGMTTPDDCNRALKEINTLPAVAMAQVKRLLNDRVKALGFKFDPVKKEFIGELVAAGAVDGELGF